MIDTFQPLHNFKDQFTFEPEIIYDESLLEKKYVIVCGMGGSAISIPLIHLLFPKINVTLHNTYGLPPIKDPENTLIILNSYSGNTEEIVDAFNKARISNVSIAILSCGGTLIQKSEEEKIPHILLPSLGIEPRLAVGYQIIGLLTLMKKHDEIRQLKNVSLNLDIASIETKGKNLAQKIGTTYPVLYASQNLYPVVVLTKSAINEGSKLPAFINIFPEANHNEIQSFVSNTTQKNIENFSFILFISTMDHERILKRFSIMKDLYQEQGFNVITIETNHTDQNSVLELVLMSYFFALYLSQNQNEEPYKTPLIAEFKKRMSL